MERKDVWAAGDFYEPYVGRWSRLVAREFVSWLSVPTNKDWLDVGCGTGALTQVILDTATPHAVTGIDASAGFIEYAKVRIDNPLASFEVGNARSLPIDTASFDAAVAALALNFVPEPAKAIAEMTRAVRPGGVVAAYVWDYAEKMELIRYFWDAAVALDPAAIDLDEGRRFSICAPKPLSNLFAEAGLRAVEVRLMFPHGFATSMIIGHRFSGATGLRPATPCHLAKIVATLFAIEFARNFRLVWTERYS